MGTVVLLRHGQSTWNAEDLFTGWVDVRLSADADIVGLNIPTGIPLRYDLDEELRPITPGGEYLDPDAAAEAIAAVAAQGR
ncbi:hypothetical protein HF526_10435 [Pseudonocardia sp. K10HN5]|uniref:phosphoglycerate mutase (2,3-diphosphoglycerate-dependent) n=1 Tax=Pseudonocardia acidicola TaxID=2724939 RepID=A0ABX1SC09_9PSEU|nr:hypothetical protein [Pseudonocardia acidicola]